ncbi:TniQ family protein [Pseudomonas sp. S1_F04]
MIPRIQRDESLHSYMQRILYLNSRNPAFSKLKKLLPYRIDNLTIKTIGSILNWPGCYGFNRLLHDHTRYALSGVFKDPYDISYSQKDYISKGDSPSLSKTKYAYCPECVRDDLGSLGYSYWRRSHQSGVTVCGNHNVILVTSCPFCDANFSSGNNVEMVWLGGSRKHDSEIAAPSSGHHLDVMWKGCSGKQLNKADSIKNDDPAAFKKAKFFNGLFAYGFHIRVEIAAHVLYEKFCSLKSKKISFSTETIEDFDYLRVFIEEFVEATSENGRKLFYEHERLINAAIAIYDSFDDFSKDVEFHDIDPCSIDSFWSSYASEGYSSVHYVEENYITGVGVWSSPYPSSQSLSPYSRDGSRARRPLIYACCNFAHVAGVGDQLAPRKVRSPMPKIPVLKPVGTPRPW